ncbi:MAG: hypothetical protein DRN15_00735 [Thermoprotei archaeon]|nr:MAG: hypothetical protein DRN15_00735 [Thermoprotei archaeon]RLF25683.1 MAG: hypothetical protein DRM97_00950 [Thermoprotei archaeon]
MIAVSGGKDSMGLMYMLSKWSSEYGFSVKALIIDEGIGEGIRNRVKIVDGIAHDMGIDIVHASMKKRIWIYNNRCSKTHA